MERDQPRTWQESLYHEKAAELILYGRALGLSHAEAQDVLQDVFVSLLDRAAPPSNPPHYLVRAFRNRAFNYRRTLWRRLTREFESLRWFERGSAESPAEQAALHCLQELPAAQREVIVLKVWHQMTFEEIGELLDVSPNTAAGRYRYGIEKLRACLQSPAQFQVSSSKFRVSSSDPELQTQNSKLDLSPQLETGYAG